MGDCVDCVDQSSVVAKRGSAECQARSSSLGCPDDQCLLPIPLSCRNLKEGKDIIGVLLDERRLRRINAKVVG